jgi:hypothetical protein
MGSLDSEFIWGASGFIGPHSSDCLHYSQKCIPDGSPSVTTKTVPTPCLFWDIAKNLIKNCGPSTFKKQLEIIISSAIYRNAAIPLVAIAHAIYKKTGKISKGNGFA